MENIKRMLGEMVEKKLISPEVESFLLNFFVSQMNLKSDIKKEDIPFVIDEMAATEFGSGLGLNDDYLIGDFKNQAPCLIAKGAVNKNISSLDLGKIFFIYCQIHDAIIFKN